MHTTTHDLVVTVVVVAVAVAVAVAVVVAATAAATAAAGVGVGVVVVVVVITVVVVVVVVVVVGSRYQFRVVAVYSNHDNKHGPNSARVRLRVGSGRALRAPQSVPVIVKVYSISATSIFVQWQVNKLASTSLIVV